MEFEVNKGIGKPVEFKGLKAQYLFWLGGGLVTLFVFNMLLYLAGVNVYLWVLFCLGSMGGLFYVVFLLNRKYGEHGLVKLMANSRKPACIINRGDWLKQLRQKR